jgi:hypothetical protein
MCSFRNRERALSYPSTNQPTTLIGTKQRTTQIPEGMLYYVAIGPVPATSALFFFISVDMNGLSTTHRTQHKPDVKI